MKGPLPACLFGLLCEVERGGGASLGAGASVSEERKDRWRVTHQWQQTHLCKLTIYICICKNCNVFEPKENYSPHSYLEKTSVRGYQDQVIVVPHWFGHTLKVSSKDQQPISLVVASLRMYWQAKPTQSPKFNNHSYSLAMNIPTLQTQNMGCSDSVTANPEHLKYCKRRT